MSKFSTNTILNEVKNVVGTGESFIQFNDAQYIALDASNAAAESILGVSVGQIEGGVRALSTAKDLISGITKEDIVSNITSNLSGVQSLIPGISSLTSSFGTATQTVASTDSDGFGNTVINYTTTVAPQTSSVSSILSALTGLSGSSFGTGSLVSNAMDGLSANVVGLASPLGVFNTAKSLVGSVGGLSSLTESVPGLPSLSSIQTTLTSAGVPASSISTITSQLTNLEGVSLVGGERDSLRTIVENVGGVSAEASATVASAIENISTYQSTVTEQETRIESSIQQKLQGTDVTGGTFGQICQRLAGTVEVPALRDLLPDPQIPAFNVPYRIGQPDSKFTYINSVEELKAEAIGVVREVSEIIVHWTDTYTDKNIGAEEIDNYQLAVGHSGIQYHYVIRRDGTLQRGEDVNKKTDHTSQSDRDRYSIAVSFVGGYNCPSGTENAKDYISVRSLTRAQFNTFDEICEAFYIKHPGIQILGHNDVDEEVFDPGFNVREYVEAKFNKKSLYKNPITEPVILPSQLNNRKVP